MTPPRYTIREGVAWDTRLNCPVLWCDGSTLASREETERAVQRMNDEYEEMRRCSF